MTRSNVKRFLFSSVLAVASISWVQAQAPTTLGLLPPQQQLAQHPASDFVVVYPGEYEGKEKAAVEKFIADNKALEERGPIDIKALISGTLPKNTPGVGPTIPVTEEMIRYGNGLYDPDNPVLNDAAYAKTLGYENIIAYPTFAACDDAFWKAYPIRDIILVSDLNHNITNYKPVYPGDTLYIIANSRHFRDVTPPEGSIYRSVAIDVEGSIYNQKGEKVQDVIFRTTESLKFYKDESMAPKNPSFKDYWEAPSWISRPPHDYTDKDWEFIKGVWAKEKRQGATPLYWEDVKIGDEPAWTLDGPVLVPVSPLFPWGTGAGASRTMRKEIMDPAIFKTMIRGEKDGVYRLPNQEDYIPTVPEFAFSLSAAVAQVGLGTVAADNSKQIHKMTEGNRGVLINYMGRDYAIRHIDNWMGDHGWLTNIRWSIMDTRAHAAFGKTGIPVNPQAEHYLDRVPKMKGKFVNIHGLTGDVAIVKSYVYDKYSRDGDHFVELVWWVENIDGQIWEEGGATVKLPSRNAN